MALLFMDVGKMCKGNGSPSTLIACNRLRVIANLSCRRQLLLSLYTYEFTDGNTRTKP